MTIETGYIVGIASFVVIGLCILGALFISRKPCWKCRFWKMLKGNVQLGECKLKQIDRMHVYERLVAKGELMNAEKFFALQTSTTKELDGCSEFEENK